MKQSGLRQLCEFVIEQVEKVVIGRRNSIEMIMKAFVCGGHVLLEDVPGVGKTLMVRSISQAMNMAFRRIQFTSDLFPVDVTGTTIYDAEKSTFEFKPGPLFTPVLLADELNRAPAKTQSALLEAMEERRITVDGHTYELPTPFIVLATQNPLEYEGTYRLPEAQLDRFLFRIRLGYLKMEQEIEMLERVQHIEKQIESILSVEELTYIQRQVREVYVDPSIKRYIVQLSEASRKHPLIRLGASPRASIALMRAAQGEAWFAGREFVLPDDVKQMLEPVFGHRLLIDDYMEMTAEQPTEASLLDDLMKTVAVPTLRRYSA